MNENVYTTSYEIRPKFIFGVPYIMTLYEKIDLHKMHDEDSDICYRFVLDGFNYAYRYKQHEDDAHFMVYIGTDGEYSVFVKYNILSDCSAYEIPSNHFGTFLLHNTTNGDINELISKINNTFSYTSIIRIKTNDINYNIVHSDYFCDDPYILYCDCLSHKVPWFPYECKYLTALKSEYENISPDKFYCIFDADEKATVDTFPVKVYTIKQGYFSAYKKIVVVDSETGSTSTFDTETIDISQNAITFETGLVITADDFAKEKAIVVENVITMIGGVR